MPFESSIADLNLHATWNGRPCMIQRAYTKTLRETGTITSAEWLDITVDGQRMNVRKNEVVIPKPKPPKMWNKTVKKQTNIGDVIDLKN